MPDVVLSLDTIVCAAVEIADAAERLAYLDRACGPDAALRGEVESLINAHFRAGRGFLEPPAGDLAETASFDAPEVPELGAAIGPYRLRELVGEGGMGLVYVAEQAEPIRRKVALKVIKPGMDSAQVVARFEAERQALALMEHPNIAKVLDAGTTEHGRPYFVMELVKGVPITDHCDANRLTVRQRLGLFLQVCRAVQHAHQKGVIHRDLKPSNVLVAVHDVVPIAKVIDFGIAKAVGQSLTDKTVYTGLAQFVGTPLYMSPEQAGQSSLDVDTRTDVYALGILLYELLTGTTPIDPASVRGAGPDELRRMIREVEPARPSARLSTLAAAARTTVAAGRRVEGRKLAAQVRGDLDWVVMKCLEKDRERRYESAGALAADVQSYLDDESVQARPPSLAYRVRRWARRHRAVLWPAAVCLLVAVTALAASVGWAARDRAARQAAADGRAQEALREVERLAGESKWPAAREAARRAEGLLAGGGSPELRQRAAEWRADLDMIIRLEEIRTLALTLTNHMDDQRVAREYAAAFREYGINVEVLEPTDAAERIQARHIREELAAALDHWVAHPNFRWTNNRALIRRLAAVATAADPDPVRNKVRDYLTGRLDQGSMLALAGEGNLTVRSLSILAESVQNDSSPDKAWLGAFRQAHRRFPGDFWINLYIGRHLLGVKPPQPDEAIRYATAAVAVRPDSAVAHHNLGRAFENKGALDDAIAAFETAIRLRPDFASAQEALARALERSGRADEAIAAYKEVLRISPGGGSSHYPLVRLLGQSGRLGEAMTVYPRGRVAESPGAYPDGRNDDDIEDHNVALHVGLIWQPHYPEHAITAFRKAIELKPGYANAHRALGEVLFATDKRQEGIAAATRAIELRPNWVVARHTRGILHFKQGDWGKAYADLSKAVELEPKDGYYRYDLGLALSRLGRHDEAIAAFRAAIEIWPEYGAAYDGIGIVLYRKGQPEQALETLDKALAVPRPPVNAHINRGVVLKELGRLDEAAAAIRKAIELDPDNITAHCNLSLVLATMGRWDQSIAAARKATELQPESTLACNTVAWLLATCPDPKLREPRRAVELAGKAVKLAPEDGGNWNTLGVAEYRARNWKAAAAALEKSMKLRNGGDANDWFFLAMTRWQLGEKAEAKQLYERAVAWMEKHKPADAELRRFRAEAAELLSVMAPHPRPAVVPVWP